MKGSEMNSFTFPLVTNEPKLCPKIFCRCGIKGLGRTSPSVMLRSDVMSRVSRAKPAVGNTGSQYGSSTPGIAEAAWHRRYSNHRDCSDKKQECRASQSAAGSIIPGALGAHHQGAGPTRTTRSCLCRAFMCFPKGEAASGSNFRPPQMWQQVVVCATWARFETSQ